MSSISNSPFSQPLLNNANDAPKRTYFEYFTRFFCCLWSSNNTNTSNLNLDSQVTYDSSAQTSSLPKRTWMEFFSSIFNWGSQTQKETPNPFIDPKTISQESSNIIDHNNDLLPVEALIDSYKGILMETPPVIPFDEDNFKKSLELLINKHEVMYNPHLTEDNTKYNPSTASMGYVEKKIVDDKSKIYVRADMHGDLKTLMLELNHLKDQGLLDASFRCVGNFHMVFLGDYMDRGEYGMQVLQLLVALKIANPDKVTLIKGNHEDVGQNSDSLYYVTKKDRNLFKFLFTNNQDEKNSKLLTNFYKTLPFSSFIGQKDNSGKVDYAMFTHGMFELTLDPTKLLGDTENPHQTLDVPYPVMNTSDGHSSQLSERVKALIPQEGKDYDSLIDAENDPTKKNQLKQEYAAKSINDLVLSDFSSRDDMTAFNWGDVSDDKDSKMENMGRRKWKLSPNDINHWMILNITNYTAIKYLFRGHQHQMKHHSCDDGKQIATTMSVAMLGPYQNSFDEQNGISYVLETDSTFEDWRKTPHVINTKSGTITTGEQMPVDSADDLGCNTMNK